VIEVLKAFLIVFAIKVGAGLAWAGVEIGRILWNARVRPRLTALRIARAHRRHQAQLRAAGFRIVEGGDRG